LSERARRGFTFVEVQNGKFEGLFVDILSAVAKREGSR